MQHLIAGHESQGGNHSDKNVRGETAFSTLKDRYQFVEIIHKKAVVNYR